MTFFKSCSGRGPGGLLGLLLGGFGWPFGGLWAACGAFWVLLGPSLGSLGPFWIALALPEWLFVAFWATWDIFGAFCHHYGDTWGAPWDNLGNVLISYTIAMLGELW